MKKHNITCRNVSVNFEFALKMLQQDIDEILRALVLETGILGRDK